MNTTMSYGELRQTLRRVYLCYNSEGATLTESLTEAQSLADKGTLVLEYGLVNKLRGKNDKMVPVNKED